MSSNNDKPIKRPYDANGSRTSTQKRQHQQNSSQPNQNIVATTGQITASSTKTLTARDRRKQKILDQMKAPGYDRTAIPRTLDVEEYVSSHLREMKDFTNALATMNSMRRVYQTVARHLRRRAMSHNVHRLPAKMRSAASREMIRMDANKNPNTIVKDGHVTHKTRKTRRAPRSLLFDRICRSTRVAWLESHLWHARRFHMRNLWGYRLPNFANDKATRALTGAAQHLCTVHDASYYECIEIQGLLQDLSLLLNPFLRSNSLQNLSEQTLNGSIEFFLDFCFPSLFFIQQQIKSPWNFCFPEELAGQLIAPITCLFNTTFEFNGENFENTPKKLWLWCHPSVSGQIESLLTANSALISLGTGKETKSKLSIQNLSGQLNRFELTGPRSTSILRAVLRVLSIPSLPLDYFQPLAHDASFHVLPTNKEWEQIVSLRSSGSILPRAVFGFQVTNPRALVTRQPFIKPMKLTSQNLLEKSASATNITPPSALVPFPVSNEDQMDVRQSPQKKRIRLDFSTSLAMPTVSLNSSPKSQITQSQNMNEGEKLNPLIPRSTSAFFSSEARAIFAEDSPMGVKSTRLLMKYLKQQRTSSKISNDLKSMQDISSRDLSSLGESQSPQPNQAAEPTPYIHLQKQRFREILYPAVRPTTQEEGFGFWFSNADGIGTERTRAAVRLGHAKLPNLRGSLTTHVMLIQRPFGSLSGTVDSDGRPRALGGGWDLVVPAGWGPAFFTALVHAGARAVGLLERRAFLAECAIPCFPQDYPETIAGRMWAEQDVASQRLHYYRRAKARLNYWKAATDFPFGNAFEALINPLSETSKTVSEGRNWCRRYIIELIRSAVLYGTGTQQLQAQKIRNTPISEAARLALGQNILETISAYRKAARLRWKRSKAQKRRKTEQSIVLEEKSEQLNADQSIKKTITFLPKQKNIVRYAKTLFTLSILYYNWNSNISATETTVKQPSKHLSAQVSNTHAQKHIDITTGMFQGLDLIHGNYIAIPLGSENTISEPQSSARISAPEPSLTSGFTSVPSQALFNKKTVDPDQELCTTPVMVSSRIPSFRTELVNFLSTKRKQTMNNEQDIASESIPHPFTFLLSSSANSLVHLNRCKVTVDAKDHTDEIIELPANAAILPYCADLAPQIDVTRKWNQASRLFKQTVFLPLCSHHNQSTAIFPQSLKRVLSPLLSSFLPIPELVSEKDKSDFLLAQLLSNLVIAVGLSATTTSNTQLKVSLLPITVDLIGRGSPSNHSMISLPTVAQVKDYFLPTGSKYGAHIIEPQRALSWQTYLRKLTDPVVSDTDRLSETNSFQELIQTKQNLAGFVTFAQYSLPAGKGGAQVGFLKQSDFVDMILSIVSGLERTERQDEFNDILKVIKTTLEEGTQLILPTPTRIPVWIRKPGSMHYFPAWVRVLVEF